MSAHNTSNTIAVDVGISLALTTGGTASLNSGAALTSHLAGADFAIISRQDAWISAPVIDATAAFNNAANTIDMVAGNTATTSGEITEVQCIELKASPDPWRTG